MIGKAPERRYLPSPHPFQPGLFLGWFPTEQYLIHGLAYHKPAIYRKSTNGKMAEMQICTHLHLRKCELLGFDSPIGPKYPGKS